MNIEYVDFPALGLRIPVIRALFRVFGQEIYTYAVIMALSIILMIILGLRHAKRYGISQDVIIDFMIFAMPASIICARLYYVIFSWDNYKYDPIQIFNIRQGGIAIYGAVIGAFLTVIIFSKVRKLDALKFFDFGVPYLILAQGIGRWGNFVNQEVFGVNTTLPWGMTSPQISSYLASNMQWLSNMGIAVDPLKPVHPTFLYESLWNILIACFLFWLRRRMKYKGEVLLGYLIGYGIGRAFIEGIRTDCLMLGGVRISQLISIVLVAAGLVVVIFFRKKLPLYADDAREAAVEGEDEVAGDDDGGGGEEDVVAGDSEGEDEVAGDDACDGTNEDADTDADADDDTDADADADDGTDADADADDGTDADADADDGADNSAGNGVDNDMDDGADNSAGNGVDNDMDGGAD